MPFENFFLLRIFRIILVQNFIPFIYIKKIVIWSLCCKIFFWFINFHNFFIFRCPFFWTKHHIFILTLPPFHKSLYKCINFFSGFFFFFLFFWATRFHFIFRKIFNHLFIWYYFFQTPCYSPVILSLRPIKFSSKFFLVLSKTKIFPFFNF